MSQIVFFVYDSRSGSTLLAKEILKNISSVFVSPEISFDLLICLPEKKLVQMPINELLELLYAGMQLVNIGVPVEQIREIVVATRNKKEIIMKIMSLVVASRGCDPNSVIVVKHGRHIMHWRELQKIFGDNLRFLHIHRDPRAVINSKLNTLRPYASYECMAWGGVLIAAVRWRSFDRYVHELESAGVKLLDVCYERLITDRSKELAKVAEFFGCAMLTNFEQINSYCIPEAEQDIHTLVSAEGILTERISGWRRELKVQNLECIEAILEREMSVRGYGLVTRLGPLHRAWAIFKLFPETFLRVVRHMYFHFYSPIHKKQ